MYCHHCAFWLHFCLAFHGTQYQIKRHSDQNIKVSQLKDAFISWRRKNALSKKEKKNDKIIHVTHTHDDIVNVAEIAKILNTYVWEDLWEIVTSFGAILSYLQHFYLQPLNTNWLCIDYFFFLQIVHARKVAIYFTINSG